MRIKHAMLAVAIAAIASSASAVDFHGYFREGVGYSSKGGPQACFGLSGVNKARFGNECDHYGEWEFSQTIYKDDAGVEVKYVFMPAYGVSNTNGTGDVGVNDPTQAGKAGYGTGNLFVQQNWAGIKLPQLGGATIWAGDRYWKREDVHSYDWFYWHATQGNTAVGIEDVDLGVGKMAFTVVQMLPGNTNPVYQAGLGSYVFADVRIYDVPLFENGSLQVAVDGAFANGRRLSTSARESVSPWVTVDFLLDKLYGGSNKLTFQYASGALAEMGETANPANTNSDNKRWRVIDQFYFAPTPEISGALVGIFEDVSAPTTAAGSGQRNLSLELRPAYHFSDYFKFAIDASYQTIMLKDAPAGRDNPYLLKVTAAPTLVTGRGFFARPEFRLFATYGKWNGAANAAGPIAGGVFGTDTDGLSFGAQVEAWW